ncbi:TonB-dependent receptor [Pedobacter sp. MC2016-24]|uniref:SusC/RagA family TonB-linked outer membrane protein n=1 Tax=Pedobacter sp. MC2016-24 TaxID=2780090 RepID=UPI00187F929F|nr:TonB-dependent receptor [Pedobacter sp. MC2016-24]MBE9601590.1 TonB-dependent receptor [Pedobacter sp. MC2016-24]
MQNNTCKVFLQNQKNIKIKYLLLLVCLITLIGKPGLSFADTAVYSQVLKTTRITLDLQDQSIVNIISAIEKKTGLFVAYNSKKFDVSRRTSIRVKNEVLEKVFRKIMLGYEGSVTELDSRHIIINIDEPVLKGKAVQDRTAAGIKLSRISGTITDETGGPLPGVNVKVKQSTTGTVSDSQGRFSLEAEMGSVLVFSYIGFSAQEVVVDKSADLKIIMRADAQTLNELVVVGYGAKRREQIIGAISSVPVKEIGSRNYSNTAEVLQGTVAGVTVVNNGGSPTSTPSFKIRGIGSINDENPLLVVDGVVYNGSINSINPKDIESISVLKDASAAIYGARASGGVVLISTKKGSKSSEPRVSLNYQQGYQTTGKRLEALNAAEFADVVNKVRADGNLSPDAAFDPAIFPDARNTKTIWMDEIFQTGKIYDLTGSVSAGSDKASIFVSGGYRRNEGVLLNSYGDRLSTRINSSFKLFDNFTLGENLSYSIRNGQAGNTSSAQEGTILTALIYPSNATIYREDGSGKFGGVPEKYSGSFGDVINPVAYLKRLDIDNPVNEMLLNPYLEWDIIKGLKFRSNWSYTRIKNDFKQFSPKVLEPGKIFNFNELTQSSSTFTSLLNEQTLQYSPSLGTDHSLVVLAGHTFENWKNEAFSVTATGFDNELEDLRYLSNSTQAIALGKYSGSGYETALESYLGRLNYSYKQKYLLEAVLRRDGTSKLTNSNRWEWYPSVSAGWVLKKESFLSDVDFVSNLKLRASWGRIGNLGVLGNYAFSIPLTKTQGLLGESTTIVPGFAETQLSNPNLKWEISQQQNLGLDFAFLNESLIGSVDVFVKENKQMQLNKILPGVAGTSGGQTVNAGIMRNSGIEASLTYRKSLREFSYSVTGNVAFLKNELKELYDGTTSFLTGTTVRSLPMPNIARVGDAFGSFFGYKTAGLFQSDADAAAYANSSGTRYQPNAKGGDIRFVDTNGDGILDTRDQVILGNPFPKFTYSLNGNLAYKGFDLNLFFQGVSGNDSFNAVKYTGLNASFPGYNLLSEVKNAWTPQNTNTSVPRLSYTDANNNFGRISDFYIEDASYLRLKSLTIGYTLPKKMLKGFQPRIYLTGQNLFTITNYSGMDPEVGLSNQGLDLGMYPVAKAYLFGIDFNF